MPAAARLLGSSGGVPGQNATFDYLVVGRRTAGLTLATRLAEQQNGSVAGEAGRFYEIDNGNISRVPASAGSYTGRSRMELATLDRLGLGQRQGSYGDEIHYARMQCIGDSSARDYMAYQRWADEVGDRSFTFDSLLPFFEKRLAFTPPDMGLRFEDGNPRYDSQVMSNGSGLLLVTFSHYVQAFGTQTTRGLEAIGIPTIPGSESGSLPGQSHSMFTVNARTMVPDSPETAFLRRGLGYSNYKKRAHAIIIDTHGLTYQLSARKGIILSAAVFGSLQLLLASGVGPAGIPQTLGVMVVADHSGMGQNMQDHIYFGPSCRVNAPTMSTLKDPDFVAEAALAFSKQAARMYTTQSQTSLLGKTSLYHCSPKFFNITLAALAEYPDDWPEVEYISLSVYLALS
ncbi:hypothetical protein BDW71DRAFT_207678 [Aspergillus fruticulosus]